MSLLASLVRDNIAWALKSLADAALDEGDQAQARVLYAEAIEILYEIGQKGHYADALCKLGDMTLDRGHSGEAYALFAESLGIHQAMGQELHNFLGVTRSLQGMASALVIAGEGHRAVRLWGAVTALSVSTGFVLPPQEQVRYDRQMQQVRAALGNELFAIAWTEGQSLAVEDAITLARKAPVT